MPPAGSYVYITKMNPLDRPYPIPPWTLRGRGVMVFAFPLAREMEIPGECARQSLLWGRTLAGFYLAQYDTPLHPADPVPWHEWGNITGFFRSPIGNGFWIDSMAVDSPVALQGGNEVWGLNKFPAGLSFQTTRTGGHAALRHSDRRIEITWSSRMLQFFMQPQFNFITWLGGQPARYSVRLSGSFRLCRTTIQVQEFPEFSALQKGKAWAVSFENAQAVISAPIQGT